MQELHVYPKKSRLLIALAGMSLFLLLGIWMLIKGPSADSPFFFYRNPLIYYPLTIIGLLGLGWLTLQALRQLAKPKPVLSLTAEGVRFRVVAWMEYQAPWRAFSGYRRNNNNTLLLLMHDPEAFAAAQKNAREQQNARRITQAYGSPFLLDFKVMEVDPAAVEQYIARHLPQA